MNEIVSPGKYDVTGLVRIDAPAEVLAHVHRMMCDRWPGAFKDKLFASALRFVTDMYCGHATLCVAATSNYHNLDHALDVTLAIARLLDGYAQRHGDKGAIDADLALIGLIGALFHDTGLLRRRWENEIDLRKVSDQRVPRSGEAMQFFLAASGLEAHAHDAAQTLAYTSPFMDHRQIRFRDERFKVVGQMLGTANFLARMAAPDYLERCRSDLYTDLVETGRALPRHAPGSRAVFFRSGDDVVTKTVAFYDMVIRPQLEHEFGGTYVYFAAHFGDRNPYFENTERTIAALRALLMESREDAEDAHG